MYEKICSGRQICSLFDFGKIDTVYVSALIVRLCLVQMHVSLAANKTHNLFWYNHSRLLPLHRFHKIEPIFRR